jgi:signal transduction histidine kinase
MRRANSLRSGAFRFAILIAALFAIGTVVLLVTVEHAVGSYSSEAASDSVSSEAAVLAEEDRSFGRPRLVQEIALRERAVREQQLRYLLIDNQGHRLAGNLPATARRIGWHDLALPNTEAGDEDAGATISLMALGERLGDGAVLVVASDTSDLEDLRRGLGRSTIAFGIGIVVLALVGGFLVGTLFLRRLDRVNRAVGRIMQGGIGERLPAIGMSSEFDDLSANLNRMLDRIEALMEGLRQVSTDIAHDLRTPLTRLRQRLEALKASVPDAASEGQVDAALAETDALLAIFRALLRIGTVEAGSRRQRFARIDLSEMLDRVLRAYLPVAEDSGHSLTAAITPGLHVTGDAELLTQAVTNLVENALFHSPRGSHVVLSLEQREEGIVLAVADDGPGVPAGERENVLRRFYRLDSSRGSPGAGLGLALVAAVAELHDAQLLLLDNGPGLRVELVLADHPI